VAYFYLGGLAAGSFVIASIADLVGGVGARSITRAGRYISLAALIPTPMLLILDLGRPERFHHMLRVFKLRSPMSVGVWGLMLFSLFGGLATLAQAARDGLLGRTNAPARFLAALPARVLGLLGMGPAFFLGSYTGVLLAATAVPLWTKSHLLIGPLFLVSAFSNATAAIALALSLSPRVGRGPLERLERLHGFALVVELGLIGAMRMHLGSTIARPLDRGALGAIFRWIVVGVGVIAPLTIQVVSLSRGGINRAATVLASLMVLSGGFWLRYVMVVGGRESAEDPVATYELAEASTDGHVPLGPREPPSEHLAEYPSSR
jgi:formate-dependent nitrite reductase membrane component NrfD